jgi:hypothetical protein
MTKPQQKVLQSAGAVMAIAGLSIFLLMAFGVIDTSGNYPLLSIYGPLVLLAAGLFVHFLPPLQRWLGQ